MAVRTRGRLYGGFFLREGKGGESDAEGLDERTERFLRESKRRKNRRV